MNGHSAVGANRTTTGTRTAFDRALEQLELRQAADEYASSQGDRGSAAYRAAWLAFRGQIRSIQDLKVMGARSRRRKAPVRTPV